MADRSSRVASDSIEFRVEEREERMVSLPQAANRPLSPALPPEVVRQVSLQIGLPEGEVEALLRGSE